MAPINPTVDALHDRREVDLILSCLSGPSETEKGPSHGSTSLWFRPILCTYGSDLRLTSVVPGMMEGPSLRLFSLLLVWRALALWKAFLASCWFIII